MRLGWGSIWGALPALLAVACDADIEETPVEAFCGGVCKAVSRCGLRPVNGGSCVSDCSSSRPSFQKVSDAGAKHLGDCMSGVECSVLNDEAAWGEAFDACWQQAKAGIPVTERTRAVCARYTTAWFECGAQGSTRECEANLGMWSSAVVEAVNGCSSAQTCDALEACDERTFGP